jgi:hypothetical protein
MEGSVTHFAHQAASSSDPVPARNPAGTPSSPVPTSLYITLVFSSKRFKTKDKQKHVSRYIYEHQDGVELDTFILATVADDGHRHPFGGQSHDPKCGPSLTNIRITAC